MASRFVRLRTEPFALALLFLMPRPAAAAWPSSPTVNVPLCVAAGGENYPDAASDGAAGALVTWQDSRAGSADIYVRRVNGAGIPLWTADGVALCAATGDQYEPKIAADGSGGAIVTWSDYRGATFDIYAQRVDSAGTPMWTPNGVAVCTAVNFQSSPAIVADGSGGAIVTWQDDRSGIDKIYAQRVNASGAPQWTANGVLLTTAVSGQGFPLIVSNGAGGAIVIWEDYRNGELDVFAQRILANGARDPGWPAAGLAIALGGAEQEDLAMAVDGNGGAFVAWAQMAGGLTRDIHVKHVLASGAIDPAWPAQGRVLITDSFDQASTAIVADGSGGAIVSWDDQRGGRDVYAQHVLATSALDPAWPATGRALAATGENQESPRMVPDGAGGAIVIWHDFRDDEGDLYAQHVMSTGAVDPTWPAAGRALSTAVRRQWRPAIVADGAGGAVVAWEDRRNDTGEIGDNDLYAQGVKANGQLGDEPVGVPDEAGSGLALEAPSPNPTRVGTMLVRFTLPSSAAASLELFDVAGRRVVAREVGSWGPGRHAIDLAAGRPWGAGVYFVRLTQSEAARVQRIVVLDD